MSCVYYSRNDVNPRSGRFQSRLENWSSEDVMSEGPKNSVSSKNFVRGISHGNLPYSVL